MEVLEISERIIFLTVRRYLLFNLNKAQFSQKLGFYFELACVCPCACVHVSFTAPYSLGRQSESIKSPLVSTEACTLSFVQSSHSGQKRGGKSKANTHSQTTQASQSSIDISYFLICPPAAEGETLVCWYCLFLIKTSLQRANSLSSNAVTAFVVVPCCT